VNESARADIIRELISWAKTIIFAVILAVFINQVVIVNATVPTGSMENNIMPNDRIVAFRLQYLFQGPKRYDIVVFRYPDDPSQLFVKRVIGLPGETVSIRGGKVYITGADGVEDPVPLEDSFVYNPDPRDFGPYKVPEGCYFMMGDNRYNSLDSRFWDNKYVEKGTILGRVLFKYYPGIKMLYNI